jgi:hypothetical protein
MDRIKKWSARAPFQQQTIKKMKLATIIPIRLEIRDHGRFTGRDIMFDCPGSLYVALRRDARKAGKPFGRFFTQLLAKAVGGAR